MTWKKFDWHFSSRLTFSNTRGRPLAELMSLFNTHLALFVRRMTLLRSQNPIRKYPPLVNSPWNLPREHYSQLLLADKTTSNVAAELRM